MSDEDKKNRKVNIWLWIGVIVLIGLLFLWLSVAEFFGDTDVAAFIGAPCC